MKVIKIDNFGRSNVPDVLVEADMELTAANRLCRELREARSEEVWYIVVSDGYVIKT